MADAVAELGSWQGEGVRLGDVERALERLRHAEQRAATRTSVVTLVVITPDQARAERACGAMHRLGSRHPGRTIVVIPRPDEPAGLDARVALRTGEAAGQMLWSEELILTVRGGAARHLDSLVEPFTLPELPVAVWFVDSVPEPSDSLVGTADGLLVDARQLGDTDPRVALSRIVELTRAHVVVDLSWVRLTPWREILAGLFVGPRVEDVHRVARAEVAGRDGPRHLIGGWLVDRIGLAPDRVELRPDEHVMIALTAETDGDSRRFLVERREGEHVVRARVSAQGRDEQSQVLGLPDDSVPWSLGTALTRLRRDPVYEHALLAALTLAG